MIKDKIKLKKELDRIGTVRIFRTYEMGLLDGENFILRKLKNLIRESGKTNLISKSKLQNLIKECETDGIITS